MIKTFKEWMVELDPEMFRTPVVERIFPLIEKLKINGVLSESPAWGTYEWGKGEGTIRLSVPGANLFYIERLTKAADSRLVWIIQAVAVNERGRYGKESVIAKEVVELVKKVAKYPPDDLEAKVNLKKLVKFVEPALKAPHDGEWFVKFKNPIAKIPFGYCVRFEGANTATGSPDQRRVVELQVQFRIPLGKKEIQCCVQNLETPNRTYYIEQTPSDFIVYFAPSQSNEHIKRVAALLLSTY